MAQKKAATAKKTPVKAPAQASVKAAVKATSKKKIAKGDSYACQVCGLGVTVAEIGNVAVEEDSVLLCCGKPMKKKASAKKTAKK
jgi:hypothetical protein